MCLPMQCLLVMTALADKAGDPTEDRPITILSNIYRVLANHDKGVTDPWIEEHAGVWDLARKGAGALDTVWHTAFLFD